MSDGNAFFSDLETDLDAATAANSRSHAARLGTDKIRAIVEWLRDWTEGVEPLASQTATLTARLEAIR